MSNQLNKNHKIILLIFGMTIIPFIFAWIIQQNPQLLVSGRTNIGKLITPPVTTERSDLTGFDPFSRDNLTELGGRWVMINVIPNSDCNEVCRDALHKTKQLRLMMNKDLTRTRRVVIVFQDVDPVNAETWWQQDTRLLRAEPNKTFRNKLLEIRKGSIPEGMLFLMDPLGNLMMQYEPGFDPYDVKKDLKKLLRISQIG